MQPLIVSRCYWLMIVAGGVLAMVLACFAASPRAEAATPERSLDMPYVKYMDPVRRTALLDKAANAGADSIRVTLPWDHLEYAGDEQYEFAWLDNFLAAAEARNLKVRGQVSGAPPWVSPCSVWEPPVGSTDLNAYQDFMFDVVSRYGTRISSYEIWNEPNLADFWQCRSVNPTEYAAMLRSAYLGAKAANPNVTIVGGALSQNDIGYLERMYTALRAYPDAAANDDFFDALGVHPYAAKNGIALAPDADPAQANYTTAFGQKNSAFLGIDYMRATLDRHGDTHKPVWIGEFGYSTDNTWMLAVPDDVRADYLKTAYSLTDQRPWIIGLCWYNYYETDRGFTIYDYATGQETLTFQAFREVASEAQPPPPPTDTTAPQTSITSGPAEGSSTTSTSATFAFTSDEQGSTFKCQLYKDRTVTQVWAACTSPKVYSNLTPGKYEFEVQATDPAGNVDLTPEGRNWTITSPSGDTAPKVISTVPTANATGVDPSTNLTATFTEKMMTSSLSAHTFKLFKITSSGTIQVTNDTVSLSTDGVKATLNPFGTSTTNLTKGAKYKAVVTTGAKDVTGNPLDQNPTTIGSQKMVWFFTVR